MDFLRFINDRERVSNSSQSVFLNTYAIKKKDRKKKTLFSTYFTNCFTYILQCPTLISRILWIC